MVTIAALIVIVDRIRDRGPRGDVPGGPFRVQRQFAGPNGQPGFQATDGAILGVTAQPTSGGVEVQSVLPGSPAERAGVHQGDVIMQADGRDVRDIQSLRDAVTRTRGQQYDLVVRRDGREQMLHIDGMFGRMGDPSMQPVPGMQPGQFPWPFRQPQGPPPPRPTPSASAAPTS